MAAVPGEVDEVVLYSYWRSSSSWRVRIALNFKKIPYRYEAVHLLKDGGEQLKDDYAEKNPMKEVPTLLIDGLTLNQSGAIIQYLDETRTENPLLPAEPAKRVLARQIADYIGTDIQPVQNLRVLKKVMAREEGEEAKTTAKLAWGKHWITNGFEALEKVLERTAGKYCVGDEVTIADLYLVPQVYNAGRFGVDMSAFPNIQRINDALKELPEFAAADPAVQPDAQ